MPSSHPIILIHPDAPSKPVPGAPCNGCGVCCLLEPCPLGMLLSGRRQGACVALRWHGPLRQYRCGALAQPSAVLDERRPRLLRRATPWLAPLLARLVARWIGRGQGCDCTVQAQS